MRSLFTLFLGTFLAISLFAASEDLDSLLQQAQSGNAEAQFAVGFHNIYRLRWTEDANKDYTPWVQWLSLAMEQGHTGAITMLGECYSAGLGVPQDDNEMMRLWKLAADQGNPMAQVLLAWRYLISNNIGDAIKYYRMAADLGSVEALCSLADIYREGTSVEQDFQKAFSLYREAADKGYRSAGCDLGECYELGEGVPIDYEEAVFWYLTAAWDGIIGPDEAAAELIDKHLNPEQVKVIEQRVYTYKHVHPKLFSTEPFMENYYQFMESLRP